MSKTLTEIAEELKASDKKTQLIYAFNGTGKTRLSREFKELISQGTQAMKQSLRATKSFITMHSLRIYFIGIMIYKATVSQN